MRNLTTIILLLCALVVGAQAGTIDTEYNPAKHAAILSFQCDDRADSTFMHVMEEHGLRMNFGLYADGGNAVQDVDSNFTNRGGYTDWLAGYATSRGHGVAVHASPLQAEIVEDYGRDSLIAIWDAESSWLNSTARTTNITGFVWTGHRHTPETRAMAKQYGFTYTRGALGYSKDLYLSGRGWVSQTGTEGLHPACMYHKILVPSVSPFQFNTSQSADTLTATAADTTGYWRGTLDALNTMAERNAFGVFNLHPSWGTPFGETVADTTDRTWVQIPDTYGGDADSIVFGSRQGKAGSQYTSPYQLAYILRACQWWNDSMEVATGSARLCIPEINSFMASTKHNMRTDDSSDPDVVSDWSEFKAAEECDEPYWTSNDGLYAKDPAVNRARKVYVDGTGAVYAGNGTAQFPLPTTAWDNLFDCEVIFTGHSVGDTLSVEAPLTLRSGNVSIDFAGLTIYPQTLDVAVLIAGPQAEGYPRYYYHGITMKNGTFDMGATTNTSGIPIYLQVGTTSADSFLVTDFTMHGLTFKNGETGPYIYNAVNTVIDSCFIMPGLGAITDNSSSNCVKMAGYAKNTLIRNSLIDLQDCGSVSAAVYTNAVPIDSLRVLNNVFILGNESDTDDLHYVVRLGPDSTAATYANVRVSGNYVVQEADGSGAGLFAYTDESGVADRTMTYSQFVTHITDLAPTFAPEHNFLPGSYGFGEFDYVANVSDTLRFGGYRGQGSKQTGLHASISPVTYSERPYVSAGTPFSRAGYSKISGPWALKKLIDDGVLAASDSLNPATWYPILSGTTPREQAQYDIFIDAYNAWPESARKQIRWKVE